MSRILGLWKEDLKEVSEKAAEALADPVENADKFPQLDAVSYIKFLLL